MIEKELVLRTQGRLSRLKLPEITEPEKIKILWMRALGKDSDPRAISKKKHKHSFFEAHFILNGAAEYETETGTITLSESCAVLFPPYLCHTVRSLNGDFIKISIAFSSESKLLNKKEAVVIASEDFSLSFQTILSELDKKQIFGSYVINSAIFSMLRNFMCSSNADKATANFFEENHAITAAKRYIDDNMGLFLTCEDVAAYCHYNSKYLGRLFKEETGKTMLEYIHSKKSKEAEHLLASSELSLSEISDALGFENEYYFNTFFKRINGISPGTYRRLIKKQTNE